MWLVPTRRTLITYSFIHSGHFYSAPSNPLPLDQRRSRLQHGYCIGVSRRSAQAAAGKELAQGPYVTARSQTHDSPVESNRLNQSAIMSHDVMAPCVVYMKRLGDVLGEM